MGLAPLDQPAAAADLEQTSLLVKNPAPQPAEKVAYYRRARRTVNPESPRAPKTHKSRKDAWTPEQLELLQKYDGSRQFIQDLSRRLGRSPNSIRYQLHLLKLTSPHSSWTRPELDYLVRHQGLLTDEQIAKKLGRSVDAIRIVRVRKIRAGKKSNIITACQAARMLGIGDAKTIIYWVDKGYLAGSRGSFKVGENRVWHFTAADIKTCLKLRPYLVAIDRVRDPRFKRLVSREYQADPWCSLDEATAILGLHNNDSVPRYIRRGLLKAEKINNGGPHQGRWIIRKSALDQFLQRRKKPCPTAVKP